MKGLIHQQTQSPLCFLPPEIRSNIFSFALLAVDDLSKPYRADRKYYRPGYQCHQKLDLSLLLTCKMVYLEARLLPIFVNEHVFHLFGGPWKFIGLNTFNTARWMKWFSSFNEEQQKAVQRIHIFTQQYYLENIAKTDAKRLPPCTKCLHLTFRNSDWWSWESPPGSSDRLGICPWRPGRTSGQQMLAEPAEPDLDFIRKHMVEGTWGASVCEILGLRELILEFEIRKEKKDQLQAVVERAKGWKFPLVHEDVVLVTTGKVYESMWEGVKELRDDYHQHLRSPPVGHDVEKRTYYVMKMVWKADGVSRRERPQAG